MAAEGAAGAPQERILSDPSCSVGDGLFQPLRHGRVFHVPQCLGEFPPRYTR